MTNPMATSKPPDPKIVSLIQKNKGDPQSILEMLRDIQEVYGGIEKEAVSDLAHSLKIPPSRAYGVATFYSMLPFRSHHAKDIRICDGPVCWLAGSEELIDMAQSMFDEDLSLDVHRSSCLGLCDHAPAALVDLQQAGSLTAEMLNDIKFMVPEISIKYRDPLPGETRVMLAHAKEIDPDSIDSAVAYGAYTSLEKVLGQDPQRVIDEIENSQLAGRGGAGFPVGRKWRFVAAEKAYPKYIICNADESEPLIFKDRILIDTNPHQILEGMAISGYATGANEAFIYIRGEYESQAALLEKAIDQARDKGYLGKNILGANFDFYIHVHRGAGAYICGEETALIESIEGKRGEPRLRPPYPPNYGYLGHPTSVNNVETFAAVPPIIKRGADWYANLGNHNSHGTKIYMVLGAVNEPGLFEAPFGLSLRQIINEFGGGMKSGSSFKFALTGGAAGTFVPEVLMDVPLDYTSARQGVSLGAGACLVCDQSVSVTGLLRNLLNFFANESCGKCTPCRVGTYRARQILDDMLYGNYYPDAYGELLSLADNLHDNSFCGLGQSVAIPLRTALKHFPEEFMGE